MPKIVQTRFLAGTVASFCALILAFAGPAAAHAAARPCANANTPTTSASQETMRTAVVCLINQQRTSRGLPALKTSQRLNRSAQEWTNAMVSSGGFDHGDDFSARITAVGFRWSAAGENIATGFQTPSQVVTGWMGSPGHCRNILDPDYASVGTGVVDRVVGPDHLGKATWTQDFGTTMGTRDPSDNWGPADSVC
jgi:uncharacterized protein YkwD